jgi:hypothetical protein
MPVPSAAPSAQNSTNTLMTEGQDAKPRKRLLAELGLSPILPNTNTARCFAKPAMGELDLTASVAVVRERANAVQAGNLAGLEETLTA